VKKPVSIRVRCPSCAEVRIDAQKLTIRVCTDTKQWSYCFLCPVCGYAVAQESDNGMLAEISGMGVTTVVWHLPGELSEPRPSGLPFTWDDLLDFHLLLRHDAPMPGVGRDELALDQDS
jgi:hypothetical protein